MRICHRCTQDSLFWQTVNNSFERANSWQFKVWMTLAESDSKFKDINGKCFKGLINKIYKKIKEIGKLPLSEIFYWLALSAFQKEINLWSGVQNPFGKSTSPACGISLVITEDKKYIEESKHIFISFPKKRELHHKNRKRKLFKI